MLSILNWIVEFFKNIWSMLTFSFEATAELFNTLVESIVSFAAFTGYGIIPTWMQSLSVLVIGVGVIKLILGRQHE